MYSINIANIKKEKNFFRIFLYVGLFILLIFVGIIAFLYFRMNSLDSKILSTKVEIISKNDSDGTTQYSPVYYYTVNRTDYRCSSTGSSNIYPGTKNQLVYYDSKNPSKCMTTYSKRFMYIWLLFLLLPISFIIIGAINIIKVNKRIKVINELNQKGKLVKNLRYHLENSNREVNNMPIQVPVVYYTSPSGSTIHLRGDARHDKIHMDADGMVDLIIDENNPDNYFIDFEINRLSGNLPTDYYTPHPDDIRYHSPIMQNNNLVHSSFHFSNNPNQGDSAQADHFDELNKN